MRSPDELRAIRDTDEIMVEVSKLSPAEQAEFRRRFGLILPKMFPASVLKARRQEIGRIMSPFPEERGG